MVSDDPDLTIFGCDDDIHINKPMSMAMSISRQYAFRLSFMMMILKIWKFEIIDMKALAAAKLMITKYRFYR